MGRSYFAFLASLCILTGCYDDYLREFDYSAAYITYQYDLRTFVAGEDESFNLPVALAGVMTNDKERNYNVSIDESLCTMDLSLFGEGVGSFNALDGMLGTAPVGTLAGGSGSYVTTDVKDAGIDELVPLPQSYYSVDFSGMKIGKGNVTTSATIKATKEFFNDSKAYGPYYAVGYRINSADVDSLRRDKSFAVVAVRAENKFFGNWYHGGKFTVGGDTSSYPFAIPQEDGKVYTLTTVDANTVRTDKYVQNTGSLILSFNGDDMTISSEDVKLLPDSRKSGFNGAKLLQDRQLFLNYTFEDAKGRAVQVSDTLYFRNRIRDGINEWQDTAPDHYNN